MQLLKESLPLLPEIKRFPKDYKGECIVIATGNQDNITGKIRMQLSNTLRKLNVKLKKFIGNRKKIVLDLLLRITSQLIPFK